MAKRNRKRKLEGDDEPEIKWELTNILSEDLRDEITTMWEIPQISHFLYITKDALNISQLSIYEMERMLAMPQASKQLAHIMTCLLSPYPKAKMRKVPPMPYDFWINVLTHKFHGWFKVYQNKRQNIVKVLESIGVEPEFWNVFPEASIIDEKNFEELTFKQRVWILKTLCDTLLHSRKTVQDEISKQFTNDQCTTVLGNDRQGARYFYFPLFLDNDLRVYRHCIDNTVLSTVKPPVVKEGQGLVPKLDKHTRNKRKRCRWKNGTLPTTRKRTKKILGDDEKQCDDSTICSSINDDTNLSSISANSNNNNRTIEAIDRNNTQSPSKMSEESAPVLTRCSNPKSSGYDTNTSSDTKSSNDMESDELFRGFNVERNSENSIDDLCIVQDILHRLTTTVSTLVEREDTQNNQTREAEADIYLQNEEDCDDINWDKYSLRETTLDKESLKKETLIFSSMLVDLSVSTFEIVADSVDSLRELAASLLSNNALEGRSKSTNVPRCERILARRIEELIESLKEIEPTLKESTRKARMKLRREWTNFRDGVMEERDTSGDVDHGSNPWILGSQGNPLLSIDEATLHTLPNSALSSPDTEIFDQRNSNVESDHRDIDNRKDLGPNPESGDDREQNKNDGRRRPRIRIKAEYQENNENDESEQSKSESEQENRRVLRRRGISSYTEQLSSEEEDAYELEEWARLETLNATPSTSDGTSASQLVTKIGHLGDDYQEKDSDQDWILPSSRKRKNKRSSTSRRVKSSPNKLPNSTADPNGTKSTTSHRLFGGTMFECTPSVPTKNVVKTESTPVICKVESVHSELDIKYEGPIFECDRNPVDPKNVGQERALPPQNPAMPPAGPPTLVRPPQAPGMPPMRQPMPGYYVRGPHNYYPPPTDPRYVPYNGSPGQPYDGGAYRAVGPDPMRYRYAPTGPQPPYPVQQAYLRYPGYGPMPPRNYLVNVPAPGYQVASTTLYSARSPNKPALVRMPGPRPPTFQNNVRGGIVRPRGAGFQPPPRRMHNPRNPTIPPSAPPVPRSTRPNANQTQPGTQKTTSLIVLSDSDDEIEMIVQEKQKAATSSIQNRQTVVNNMQKLLPGARIQKGKPVVKSEITMPKSREMLSQQMLNRMSQGGISITPVKASPNKPKPMNNDQGTKLVVVVNETGSHYALALPNGSKLILTPEQVAQIRASNNGKLVL